jgi:curli biogenesis system outer membrane secretion channel CsgG
LPGAVIGGALGSVQQSHVAIVVQIVDAKTSRLLFSSTVEGKANDFNLGGLLGGLGGHVIGAAGLGVWQKTPVEKAIRVAILNAVQEISKKTPSTYYRHGSVQAVTTQPAAISAKPAAVEKQTATPTQPTDLSSAAVVKVKTANLRDAPGAQGKVVATIKEGTKLAINAEEKDWYYIQTEEGKSGWISKSLIK